MGFTPQQVDRMHIWEFIACVSGHAAAHGGEAGPEGDISEDRLRALGIEGF